MTGLSRQQAAEAVAALFGATAIHSRSSRTYDPWEVTDNEGKTWRFVFDASIRATHRSGRRQLSTGDDTYKVEMNSPKLEYSEMGKLQDVVRTLRHAGAVVNSSCGMHIHVDASKHTPQSLKNALSIMYSKEDILFKALKVDERRVERWCQKVREPMLEKIRRLPTNTTMDRLKREWYEGGDGSYEHYNWTRYYALNLHSVFYRGTLEWRCFESTLHAGKVRANITLALAISAQAINQKRTVMRKTEISENPAFTFRTFLLRLGLIGPEYKNVREHLLSNLPGDRAWRYDKSQYPSLQNRRNQERYEESIRSAVKDSFRSTDGDLMPYFSEKRNPGVKAKVLSAIPSVELRDGELMGCTTVRLKEPLNDVEMKALQEYLRGQFSDGWGEGFEQWEIYTEDGTLYVHFWNEDSFSFEAVSVQVTEPAKEPSVPKRPKMKLAGMDGNIFFILGKASQLLKRSGQPEQAKEMTDRVYRSGDYGKALSIISEYVETELSVKPPVRSRKERDDAR